MTTQATTTLEAAQTKIELIAKMYANGDPSLVDEIVSRTNLHIWTNGQQNETEAFILQAARWQATDVIDGSRSYSKYVGSIEAEFSNVSEGDEELDWTEYVADQTASPEQAAIEAEYAADFAAAIDSLTVEQQTIVTLLSKGFSCAEIAAKKGMSRAAISQKMSAIRNELSHNPSMAFAL